MEKKHLKFSAGQFAKLHNINKRTLHYYDEIGLFSPSYKGENGYRYYTYLQSASLEMILTLREIKMSIEEITQYMQKRSSTAFCEIIETKTLEIDETIRNLKEVKKLLNTKQKWLDLCEEHDLASIDIIKCEREYLLLSSAISGAFDDCDLAILIKHMQEIKSHRQFNKSYGSMISCDKICQENYDDYDCFFTKVEKQNNYTRLFLKPSGNYIRAFCKGNWDNIADTYKAIITFCEANDLILKGYAYEEGINEIAINSIDDYITQITILCEFKKQ